jgi:hypothetical protein
VDYQNDGCPPIVLRPDLAVLHWSWSIQSDRNEDSTPRKPRFGLFTMIVEKRGGDWPVVATTRYRDPLAEQTRSADPF